MPEDTTAAASTSIPKEMRRLVVVSPGKGTSVADCMVEVQTVPTPQPGPGEVLIKVAGAPINPSDYGKWYRTQDKDGAYPMPMGLEGSGVVVATGNFLAAWKCPVGTPVGFVLNGTAQGSYSEYVTASVFKGVFAMPTTVPIEDCCSHFVNPMTALAILDTAKQEGSPALVHTAAASQLGQMLVKLAPSHNMTIVNVVRRDEQAALLRGLGAEHVVVTSGDDWKETLRATIREVGATCAFDAVAGSTTGDLMDALPSKSTVYVYGGLAGKVGNVNPMDLIYRQKKLRGFLLTPWILQGGLLATLSRLHTAGQQVAAGLGDGGWASSRFRDVAPEDALTAIVELLSSRATGTKLRVRFDPGNA